MKKLLLNFSILPILVLTTINWCVAQTDATYKLVAQETCDCINKDNVAGMSKNQVEASLGVCMLQSIQKNKINVEITDADAMRAFGEKVGALMAPICPAVFKVFLEEGDSDTGSANANVISIEGKVKAVEDASLLYITVKDNSGNEQKIVWFSYFEGSDAFASDPKKLIGKNVSIQCRSIQGYSPKAKGYMSMKELVGLKVKD